MYGGWECVSIECPRGINPNASTYKNMLSGDRIAKKRNVFKKGDISYLQVCLDRMKHGSDGDSSPARNMRSSGEYEGFGRPENIVITAINVRP